MRRQYLSPVGALVLLAAVVGFVVVQGCSTTPAQVETPQRFVELANQFYPSVVLMQDTATGTCWITTQRAEAGWTQAPKEACEVQP